jgi:diphthine-ammonia ligase
MPQSASGQAFLCSWSGGKDSCLALYRAVQAGGRPKCLFTMMAEDEVKSRSHGLPRSLIQAQARRLDIPVLFRSASWDEYERVFLEGLRELQENGIQAGVFGDIDVESHREWVKKVCASRGITPFHPLWKRDRRELLYEFIDLGFIATIVVVNGSKLGNEFLGRRLDRETLSDLEHSGIDPSGELGEYHTVVTAGPLFSSEIAINVKGRFRQDGYEFLDVDLDEKE